MTRTTNPYDIAPASARRVESEFKARQSNDAWAVFQDITWKDYEGDWDGAMIIVRAGLTESEARALAASLAGVKRAA